MPKKAAEITLIILAVFLFASPSSQARMRNPWVVVSGHVNLWSAAKTADTHDHWPEFAEYDPADPDLFFRDLIGEMMVYEHRCEGSGVPAEFEDFGGHVKYGKKNGYTYHDGTAYHRDSGIAERDWVKYTNTLGCGYCGVQNAAIISLASQLGLEARGMTLDDGAVHYVSDIFFDGGWHHYDLDLGGWSVDAAGDAYGLDTLIDDQTPFDLPSGRSSLGSHNYFYSYATDLAVAKSVMAHPQYLHFGDAPGGADMSMCLRIGEKFERFWDALDSSYKVGDPALVDGVPLWGNGRITYAPNLAADYADFLDGVYEKSGISQNDSGLIASGDNAYAVWAVRSGNPIVSSTPTATGTGISISYSDDMGVTWQNFGSPTAVQGLYDYLLRIDFANGGTLTGLEIITLTMLNPGALPRLREGDNSCQLKLYDNDETLTMRPDWSSQLEYDKYMVEKNVYSWGESRAAVNPFHNGGVSASDWNANHGGYATLKLPGPKDGEITAVSGWAGFCRKDKNAAAISGWTEDNSVQLRLSSNQTANFVKVANNTLHNNTGSATLTRMEGETGFGTYWANVGVCRAPVPSAGTDAYLQIYNNNTDDMAPYLTGMTAYAHYHVNHLEEDYLNNIRVTHRWNIDGGGTGSFSRLFSAAEISAGHGTIAYNVAVSDSLLIDNPNHSITMEIPGGVLFSELENGPSAKNYTVGAAGADHTTVQAAVNACAVGDTITIIDAVHTESGIVIDKALTITGRGIGGTILQAAATSGTAVDRVFDVTSSGVMIRDMTIRHGNTGGDGGALRYQPSGAGGFSMKSCVVADNSAAGNGGGVYIRSSVAGRVNCVIDNCELVGNASMAADNYNQGGGGVFVAIGGTVETSLAVTVTSSTIAGNQAESRGGGIFAFDSHSAAAMNLSLSNCTVSGNKANGTDHQVGGGLASHDVDAVSISNSTIAENVATNPVAGGGGGLAARYGALSFRNCLIADNYAVATDHEDYTHSNLDDFDESCNFVGCGGAGLTQGNPNANGSVIGHYTSPIEARLGALADNGGSTMTHVPALDSPAARLVPRGGTAPYYNASPDKDQRRFWIEKPVDHPDYLERSAGACWQAAAPTPARGFRGRITR